MKPDDRIFIALGTNLGDRSKNLLDALEKIENSIGSVIRKSAVYVSAPFGFEADTDFFNQVIKVKTDMPPEVLLNALKQIEVDFGRVKKTGAGYESRIIDLDIIDYKGKVLCYENLKIPHDQMIRRDFVLLPLEEIEPGWIHPVTGQTVSELIELLGNAQMAKKLA